MALDWELWKIKLSIIRIRILRKTWKWRVDSAKNAAGTFFEPKNNFFGHQKLNLNPRSQANQSIHLNWNKLNNDFCPMAPWDYMGHLWMKFCPFNFAHVISQLYFCHMGHLRMKFFNYLFNILVPQTTPERVIARSFSQTKIVHSDRAYARTIRGGRLRTIRRAPHRTHDSGLLGAQPKVDSLPPNLRWRSAMLGARICSSR